MNFVESLDLFHVSAKEIPCLTGKGAPTEQTEGVPGVLYMDTDSGELYKCRGGANGAYRWEMQGGSVELTDADKAEIVAMVLGALDGKVISGYVDSGNNIIITGLRGGSYTVKYEMEDGCTIDIGNLELDTNVYYSITNNLTNCVSSNGAAEIVAGGRYSATITANSGYELESVVVTMCGMAVTVENGVIEIASVTGNIVVTATATEKAGEPHYTNWLPLSVDADGSDFVGAHELGGDGWEYGYKISGSSGNPSAIDGAYVSGFIPITPRDQIRIKNIAIYPAVSTNNIVFYDENKVKMYSATTGAAPTFNPSVKIEGDVYRFSGALFTEATNIAFFRFSCGGITEETIVTINEEIV